jgi:creatinine amidohydrolase
MKPARLIFALPAAGLLCWAAGAATAQSPAPDEIAAREARIRAMHASERPIAAGDSYWIEELTWLEVRDRIREGWTTVIIPTGGVEENGPYISTGKHNVILQSLCPSIAAKLGNALCAPIVKFVPEGSLEPPSGAMRFPGSITLQDSTYEALLEDITMSLKVGGFTDIVLIGDSGGNQDGMHNVAVRLNERWQGTGIRAHFVREFYTPGWEETEKYTKETLGVVETKNDGHHDDIWVTAMMAVTDPAQIRYDQRVAAGLASINGVPLEPLEKTVELGRKMVEFRAGYTAEAIRQAIAGGQ